MQRSTVKFKEKCKIELLMPLCLELVNGDIGFQYGDSFAVLPDASFATSPEQFVKDTNNPRDGRLYKPWEFFCQKDLFDPFYLELIVVQKYYVFAISVQGKRSKVDRNVGFKVSYSDNYADWMDYNRKYTVSIYICITLQI